MHALPPGRFRGARRMLIVGVAAAFIAVGCSSNAATNPPAASSAGQPSSAPGGASSGASAASSALTPATIDLWLGGVLTTSTAGSPYDNWVQHVITRFKAANPGSDVKVTLLPADNGQLAAQVQAAFASKKVPDVMLLYSGAYTTAYQAGLAQLNNLVNATPGFYDSLTGWDGSCVNFDCQGGSGQILGVPADNFAFFLWYRKDILAQAGITAPAATWDDMIAQCDKLVAAGIMPWVYGDRDGYTTSNMMTTEITSFFDAGDVQKVLSGDLKYTDPKFISSFNAINELNTHHCVAPSSSTREQLDAASDLLNGKVAYMEGAPGYLPEFAPLGDKIGVTRIPYAGTGSLASKLSTFSNGNWVIPANAAHPDLGWSFIKLATDPTAQGDSEWVSLVGTPPANKEAASKIVNPLVNYMAQQDQDTGMAVLDSVMNNAVALDWYRELQQAFAGKISIQDALQAVQTAQDQAGP